MSDTPQILVFGNVNADWVVQLDAPVATGLETTGANLGLRIGGAAANTASALAVAGNHARLVGFIGSDDTGVRLMKLMQAEVRDWDLSQVLKLPGATPACLILVDPGGERVIVGLYRERRPVTWPALDLTGVAAAYAGSRWPLPADLVARFKEKDIPVACQWRGPATIREAEVLVVSEAELPSSHRDDPWRALRAEGCAPGWLVVTQGARGAWASDGQTRLHCAAPQVEVVDATGAGDAFAAGLTHGLARRWPMEVCLAQGCAWGARAVTYEGSVFPNGGEDAGKAPIDLVVRDAR
jgi:sugar/nucleoside kinase (ribokinase family)